MLTEIPQLAAQQPTPKAALDAALARLDAKKQSWATLPVAQKAALVDAIAEKTARVAERWAVAATAAKGIPADSPLAGEE